MTISHGHRTLICVQSSRDAQSCKFNACPRGEYERIGTFPQENFPASVLPSWSEESTGAKSEEQPLLLSGW